ncbi:MULTISPECIES: ABC transporter substrate-binding protein [unclassified Novosphingobium]|uniref:ABC transporter substrate-binding protein n=1 Tax=unclassified Novosphingobium TaxID=2644732 RepID=UPI00135C8551|nr:MULTISPECIES: ABC transporter substrate-binding protein [unclassified Novosphingobium]
MIRPSGKRWPLALATALAVAGCGGAKGESEGKARLRWAFMLPTSWDPVTSRTGADINTVSIAYASLTRLDKDGNVQPALAKSWRYSPDGRTLTFELRDKLTFTDGTALDAGAVKAFFERGKTQKDSFLRPEIESIATFGTDGPLRVVFHLSRPDYQLPYVMAGRVGAIASPSAAAKDKAKLALWPVGAGPFKIVEFVPESHAYFVKNPDYWDAANIHIDRLELTTLSEPTTTIASLVSGAIDVASIGPQRVAEARARNLTVTTAPSLNANDLMINRNKAPFNDPLVAEAVRYAIDRKELVRTLTVGLGTPTNQPFPPHYFAFDPQTKDQWLYDPAKAKALLAQPGHAPGSVNVEIVINPLINEGLPELLQAQLAKVGIKSHLRIVPPGSSSWQSEVYIAKRPAAAVDGTVGRESPVQNLLAVYGPQGIMNLSGPYSPKAFLEAVDKVRATPIDAPEYRERLQRATRLGATQSTSVWLFSTPFIVATRPRVKHLNIVPSQIRWEGVTVE